MAKLIYKNLVKNWKRSMATVFSLALSVVLVFTSLSIYYSFLNMRLENAYSEYGRYNLCVHGISDGEMSVIIGEIGEHDVEIGIEKIISVEGCLNIISADDEAFRMNNYSLFKGRLPEKEGEIVLPPVWYIGESYITQIKDLGDEIAIGGKNYTIVGFLADFCYDNNDKYLAAITYDGDKPFSYNLYLHFNESDAYKNAKTKLCNILDVRLYETQQGDKAYAFYSGDKIYDNYFTNKAQFEGRLSLSDKNIGTVILLFGIVLFVISLMFNIHVFYSYFGDRRSQAGILKSIGFTDWQIVFLNLTESIMLNVCGILLGLFAGNRMAKTAVLLVQSRRIAKLKNFSACLDTRVYRLTFLLCFLTFIAGALPAIIKNAMPAIKKLFVAYKRNRNKSFTLIEKILVSDENSHRLEKLTIYISLVLTGIIFTTMGYLKQYLDYEISQGEEHRSQFTIIMEDSLSGFIEGIQSMVEGITKYDVIYNKMGAFLNPDELIKNDLSLDTCVNVNGDLAVDIYCVSRELYYESFSISSEISYEEFEQGDKAILVSNDILRSDLSDLKYSIANDDGEAVAYDIGVLAYSEYTGFGALSDITMLVPNGVMSKIMSRKLIFVYMNVENGMEIDAAKKLDKMKKDISWGFNVNDNVSEYICKKDDNATITFFSGLMFLYIMLCVALSLFLILRHRYFRLERYFRVLKVLGYSDLRIVISELLLAVKDSMITALIALFIMTSYYRKGFGDVAKHVVLNSPFKDMLFIIAVVFVIQLLALLILAMRMRKQKTFWQSL